MTSFYTKLVEERGADGAKDYMRELRSKVKKPGLASATPEKRQEVSKLGNEAKRLNAKLPKEAETEKDA